MVLPPDDCNLIPDVAQFLSHIIVGIEQSLSSLVNEVNIPDVRQSYTTTSNNDQIRPVKIFDHCLQFLELLDTKLVFLQKPHGAWKENVCWRVVVEA